MSLSTPVLSTSALADSTSAAQLLDALLDSRARRRLVLHQLDNETLRDRYIREVLRLTNRNDDAFDWNCRLLHHFFAFLSGARPTPDHAAAFLAEWQARGATNYSLYKYGCVLRGFLRWYGEDFDLKLPVDRPLPRYVSHEAIDRFREGLKQRRTKQNIDRDLMLVDIGYGAGLRRGELAALRVCDLALDQGFLIVRKGKGRKDRTVYLPSWLVERLRAYTAGMDSEARLFPISRSRISDIMTETSQRIGLRLRTHDLRHGFGTRLAERNVPMRYIQELMGHASLETTQIYAGFTAKHLREAVSALEGLDRSVLDEMPQTSNPYEGVLPAAVLAFPLTIEGRFVSLNLHKGKTWRIVGRWASGQRGRNRRHVCGMGQLEEPDAARVRAALRRLNAQRRHDFEKAVSA